MTNKQRFATHGPGGADWRTERPLEVLVTGSRSTKRLGGAWVDIYQFDEPSGRPFNAELGKMTDQQWRELVQAMHAVDQNLLVITMMFNNHTQRGLHKIETEGYHGKAFYPSKLSPDRMPIASKDPLEAILSEADRLGMHVMPGVGCYAFFDFSPASLRWHKQVADKLWQRDGRHPSFFRNTWELHPRPIEGLVSDLSRFQNFEKILHYEFPGMMSSPKMSRQPGGPASVRLYKDYERYLREGLPPER